MTSNLNTNRTDKEVSEDVKKALISAGYDANNLPYFSVRAVKARGCSRWSYKESGMFTIDMWGIKNSSLVRSREHMFRTDAAGTVPIEKITEYATHRYGAELARKAAEKARADNQNTNAAMYARVKAYADSKTSRYISDYNNSYGTYIGNTGEAGKLTVNLGALSVDEATAMQLIDILAKVSPK